MLDGVKDLGLKLVYQSLSKEVREAFDRSLDELYNLAIKGNMADKMLAMYLDKLRRACRG